MAIKDNLNNPSVWREAMFKFLFCWLFCFCLMQSLYYWTDWYDAAHMVQLWSALGVGIGNAVVTFIKPQS